MSFIVTQCSKSEVKEERAKTPENPEEPNVPDIPSVPVPPSDVPVLDYLKSQKPDVASRWKIVHARIIHEELYTLSDMPFDSGLVKFDTSGKSCVSFPVAYWEKSDSEARCVVTIHFDCNGNYRRHTSECIVL